MKKILFVMAIAAATAGCSKKSDSGGATAAGACAPAINKAIDAMISSRKTMMAEREKAGKPMPPGMAEMMDKVAIGLRTVFTERCEADKWSDAVVTCFASATDQPSIKKCRDGLPPEQAKRLQTEVVKVMSSGMGGMGGPGGPGMGGPGGPGMGGPGMHGMGGPGGPGMGGPGMGGPGMGGPGPAAPAAGTGANKPRIEVQWDNGPGSAAPAGSAAGSAK